MFLTPIMWQIVTLNSTGIQLQIDRQGGITLYKGFTAVTPYALILQRAGHGQCTQLQLIIELC
jgi:hypothetical protein